MPFGLRTWVGPRNHVRWDAHWHNEANMIEPSMSGDGSAAFLSNYFDHLSLLGRIAYITYVEAACCYRSSIVAVSLLVSLSH